MISFTKSVRILATLLVRNEEDIIAANIEHHLSHGVTDFIVTDNGSKDNTKAIAAKYPEVREIIDESDDTHNQSISVSRMAKLACHFHPDWIIHLDADELWCGLHRLKTMPSNYVGCTTMYLHPPTVENFTIEKMRYYLDFENIPLLPGECKVAHRPDPEIQISHGNHGFLNRNNVFYTKGIWRHHYPIRGILQFRNKIINGHESLIKRNSICERWKKWYDSILNETYELQYDLALASWESMIRNPNEKDLYKLLEMWSTPEAIQFIKKQGILPKIGEWPRKL